MLKKIAIGTFASIVLINQAGAVTVPGSVPPVQLTTAGLYADDTRGIAVPEHEQFRLQSSQELLQQANQRTEGVTFSDASGNTIVPENGARDTEITDQLEKIANDPGFLSVQENPMGTIPSAMPMAQTYIPAMPVGQEPMGMGQEMQMMNQQAMYPNMPMNNANAMAPQGNTAAFQQVNTGFKTVPTQTGSANFNPGTSMSNDGGVEIAIGRVQSQSLDLKNAVVKLREDRVSIRRVVRRMLDQVGGGAWNIVWSLSQENANLPDMEISIYTQEPFMNVLNALLARLQTRSGQSLRVIKYDNAQKIIITDQQGSIAKESKAAGVNVKGKIAVTEQVLKEAKVVLHYDEIPLVDALENIVNQASDGQWRLRVYAGMDQVLKPAHIEEPFNIAMERILTLFNLKYEVFPGGKLVVVTGSSAAGFTNMQQ